MLTKELAIKNKKAIPFEFLSIKQQKKRIVKDAIKQIEIENFKPKCKVYISFKNYIFSNEDLKSVIKSKKNPCKCCAKGAIFASCVMSINKVKAGDDFHSESFIKRKLIKWFGELELDMIETAFEKRVIADTTCSLLISKDGLYNGYDNTDIAKKCIKFGRLYKEDKERMIAILKNILKNETFKP